MTPAQDDELQARIDDALARALAVAPSPEFLSKVRARVAEPRVRRSMSVRFAAAGLAAAATILIVVLQFRAGMPPAPPVVSGTHAAPAVGPVPPLSTSEAHRAPATGQSAPLRRPASSGGGRLLARSTKRAILPILPKEPRIPEVVLSPAERIAFERFVADLTQIRIDATALALEPGPTGRPARIAIAPIDIKPLTPE